MIKNFLGRPAYFAIWIVITALILFLNMQANENYKKNMDLLEKNIYDEAKAHFNNMIIVRSWNALHGGVYVKQREGIEPNPYLKNNKLIYDSNKTLVKINPAWMTRQVSEIANKESKSFYKITSLRPLNPSNQPDEFEREALNYFEKNSDKPYYSKFEIDNGFVNSFNFMGKLDVEEKCMQCHADQNYKIGDIRGGIRVSLPIDNFRESAVHLKEKLHTDKIIIVIMNIIIGILLSMYIRKIQANQHLLASINNKLERKVKERTKSLDELNSELEERVKKEVAINRQNEEVMIVQSRHAAMGEIISMLAHQWRQPIAVVEMAINNLLVDIELGDVNIEALRTELGDISKETEKLSKTITEFSEYFQENTEPVKITVEDIIRELLEIIKSSLDDNNISFEITKSLNHTMVTNKEKLLQVYLTIINNAKEILVERNIRNRAINISIEEDSKYIITKICDTAGGIPPDSIEKVFEPYFSTKSSAEGVGLGLYMAKIIVDKQLNGRFTVENELDGACFSVYIPKLTK